MNWSGSCSPKSRRAFTLIELMVVILIIAIMSSVIVPAYERMANKARFDGSIRQMRDIFAEAQQAAIANDTTATVTLNQQQHTLTYQLQPAPPTQDLPTALMPAIPLASSQTPPPIGDTMEIPPQVAVASFQNDAEDAPDAQAAAMPNSGNQNMVRFYGDGTCDGADVMLRSMFGYAARITVWPSTGASTSEDLTGQ